MKDSAAVYMIPRFKIIVVVLFFLALGTSYCPAVTFVWNGSDSEDWYDPGNWTPFGVPGTNDIIDITNGTIDLTSPVTIGGQLNWSGGLMWDSELTIATNGVLNIEGSVLISNDFNNYGTINWQAGSICFGANEGGLANQSTGTVNIQCDQTMSGGFFGNSGTIIKSAGTNTSLITSGFNEAAFYGNWLTLVQTGTLWFSNFDDGEVLYGDMEAALNATLLLSGNVFLQAPLNFGGAGTILVSNATIDGGPISGHLSCAATELLGDQGEVDVTSNSVLNIVGDLTVDENASLMNYGTINWLGGAIDDNGSIIDQPNALFTIDSAQPLNLYGGGGLGILGELLMEGGTNTCVIAEDFGSTGGGNPLIAVQGGTLFLSNFTGGDTLGGEIEVMTNATLLISGNMEVQLPLYLGGTGTILASNAFVYGAFSGQLACAASEINLDVPANGILNIVGDITNDGLNNSGTVNWQNGLFQDNGGIRNQTGSVFAMNSGQALTLSGGGGFEASGQILVQGGTNTCTIDEIYSTYGDDSPSIVVQSGTLWLKQCGLGVYITGDIEVATNASLLLSGRVVLTPPMNLGGAGTILMSNGTLDGTFTGRLGCTGAEITTGLTVTSNGTLNVVGDTIFDPGAPLINYGAMNWQGGLIDNDGGVYNQAGAVITINSGQPLTCWGLTGGPIFGGPGKILVTGGTNTVLFPDSDLSVSGKLEIQSGCLELGAYSSLQSSNMCFHITNPTNYGRLAFDWPIALSGNLSVVLDHGYVPNPGAAFDLVTYTSNPGYFDSIRLPSKYAWSTNYSPSQFTLTALGLKPVLVPSLVASGTPGQPSELQLTFTGNANAIYSVLATTNLALPLSCWSNLGTASALSSNSYQFVDPQSTNLAARFYGVRLGDDPGSP